MQDVDAADVGESVLRDQAAAAGRRDVRRDVVHVGRRWRDSAECHCRS
jgi:hypothetical protein